MRRTYRDPDYDPIEDYDYRAGVVAIAKLKTEASGYALDRRLLDLCDRYIEGDLTEDEFKIEIVRPYLH